MSTDPDAARVLAALERSHTEALDVMLGIHFPQDAPHPQAERWARAEARQEVLERFLVDEEGRFVLTTVPVGLGALAVQETSELEQAAVDVSRCSRMTADEAREALERAMRAVGCSVRQAWVAVMGLVAHDAARAAVDLMEPVPLLPHHQEVPPADPRERALRARRRRGTGPKVGRYRYDGTRRNG